MYNSLFKKRELQMYITLPSIKSKMSGDASVRRQHILSLLPATAREIEKKVGYTHGGSFTQLNNLLNQGQIERVGIVYRKKR